VENAPLGAASNFVRLPDRHVVRTPLHQPLVLEQLLLKVALVLVLKPSQSKLRTGVR
jgi:hypothetical protein